MSSSVMPLLITRRSRSLPASGATVAPVRLSLAMSASMRGESVPARSDGRLMATWSARQRPADCSKRLSRAEKSPEESDRKDNSS